MVCLLGWKLESNGGLDQGLNASRLKLDHATTGIAHYAKAYRYLI